MRFVPVRANAHFDFQWHTQFSGRAHVLAHAFTHFLDCIGAHFEHQFVVHLHDEARWGRFTLRM